MCVAAGLRPIRSPYSDESKLLEAAIHQVLGGQTADRGVVDVNQGKLRSRSQHVDDGKASLANRVGVLAADIASDDAVALPIVEPVPRMAAQIVVMDEPRTMLAHVAPDP